MDVAERVRKTIEEHELIEPGCTVVLGLSGGPDSLCLLHVLCGLRGRLKFSLSALHVNHLMRLEAEEDVRFLEQTCSDWQVPLTVVSCDVRAKAAAEGISTEEAGRAARHEALRAEAARLAGAGAPARCAFAHTLDDQAETVLMRILRGTGVHGLAAMAYRRADGVIRPLLDVPRCEVEAYCRDHGLRPRFDSTNASEAYTRNLLRSRLMPLLREEYNPNLSEALVRLAQSAREDDAFLSAAAQDVYQECLLSREKGRLQLSYHAFRNLPPALQKRVAGIALSELGLTHDIAATHLNALVKAVREERFGKTIQFSHGCFARILAKGIFFGRTENLNSKEKQE